MTSQPHAPTVGGYTLLTKIGEGGMGVVHLAQRGDGPRVALKMLRPHIVGDEEARQRLAREVSSLHRVRSRWVAEIVDADPWAEIPYVATRYVPGLSLHDHVRHHGPVQGGDDLTWFAGCLAEGLASVHAVGVLHRDIKPSNVLMEGRTPILIDFGLARVADDPRLTHTGWLLGTPGYLAPEILYGDDASAASDLHSWAATVAFAGTGAAPFGRGPSMAIMDRVRRGEHDLRGLSGPLRDVVVAALDPEPSRRPTLAAVLDWVRPQTTHLTPTHAPTPHHGPTPTQSRPVVDAPDPVAGSDPYDAFDAAIALAHDTPPVHDTPPAHDTPSADDTWPVWDDGPVHSAETDTTVLPEAPPPPYARRLHPVPAPPTLRDRVPAPRSETARGLRPVPHPAPTPPVDPWTPHDQLQPPLQLQPTPGTAVAPLAERSRRLALVVTGAILTGAACALAPWVSVGVVVVAVWLLRSGSLAASAVGERRMLRGRKWYDAPQLLIHTPWHLVQSIPGAAMLLTWAGGLAIAAALVCYAVAATVSVSLFVTGFVLALALWWGPGGSRLRGPLGRVIDPISRRVGAWVATTIVVLGLALLTGAWVEGHGPSWTPGGDRPFAQR